MNPEELKERIEKLSPKQKALLAYRFKARHLTLPGSNGQNTERLVAYIVDDGHMTVADFRNHLKERLPEYMVPAAFVQLDEFPKLPNGKIDNRALPAPEESAGLSEADYVAPRNPGEQKLAEIWSEVLNFDPVGIHDNFFEMGGDSILSIRIIAKANKAGMVLKPNALFEYQTIAQLAPTVEDRLKKPVQNETITGEIPLLPIQHWFFEEHQHAPHHWNQGLLFKNTGNLTPELLHEAIQRLTLHHDALRLQFVKNAGKWQAYIAEPQKIDAFQKIDLGNVSLPEQEKIIHEKTKVIQSGLILSEGPLFQGIYFDCGKQQPGRFLLFAHHLLVDAVSWGILVEDLHTICNQLQEGNPVTLPRKTTSYKDWSMHLMKMAKESQTADESEFWQRQRQSPALLPCDFETNLPVTEEGCATITFVLDTPTTGKLRSGALAAYNTKLDEFLLAVLTRVIGDWTKATGIGFGLERHGRETMNPGMDLSNTVGWFTAYFPVTLVFNPEAEAGTMLKSIKEQLRRIPRGGLGYGMLRYLCEPNHKNMDKQYRPPIIFNYLGSLSPFNAGGLGTGEEVKEGTRHPQSERFHLLEINAFIQDDQLKVRWEYHRQLHLPDTINSLVQAFEKTLLKFIEHCGNPETGGFTPSDFPEAGLNQDDLDNLLGAIDL